MKMTRYILLFMLPLILWPCLAWPQETSLAKDPVFRSARKAQQEGRTAEAEKILNDRIHAIEQAQPNSPELVPYLNLLAQIYSLMKRQTADAHAIYERVLEIDRSAFGPGDGRSLRDLVNLASTLGPEKNDEKEQLLKQALDLALQNPKLGPDTMAGILSNLAALYKAEQRWHEAEPLAEQGMKICASMPMPGTCEYLQNTLAEVYRGEGRTVEGGQVDARNMDADFPPELDALNKSAQRYENDGLYAQAEFTYRQAAAWIEAHPLWTGGKIPTELTGMLPMEYNGIGNALEKQGRNDLAEEAFKKAISSEEERTSDNQISLRSFSFWGLMDLYRKEGRLNELEPIIQHALGLQERTVGESSTMVAQTLVMYGDLYKDEGKYVEAKPLYERAMKIEETNLGPYARESLSALYSYADLLVKLHEDAKAAEIQTRISEIEKKQAVH
jgi:tetratricopeptide (TPR) repeat protein